VVPAPASDLGWARQEPVRTIRFLIQRGLLLPFTEAMAHPKVEGREWVRDLERPVIFAANHSSHADTSLILHALGDRARDRTVVAAAADYWFKRPLLGNIVSLFLNTFPFSRTGGAQAQLHSSSQLLKSGWNLVLFPEGSRSPDGRIHEFKPGVGHLANETGTPVVPMHIRGSYQIIPRGQALPLPGPARVRIGKPMSPEPNEGSRQFTARVEKAVRTLALEPAQPEIQGSWVERWRLMKPRELRYEESPDLLPASEATPSAVKAVTKVRPVGAPPLPAPPEKPGGRARSAAAPGRSRCRRTSPSPSWGWSARSGAAGVRR